MPRFVSDHVLQKTLDLYNELRTYVKVANALKIPVSTAQYRVGLARKHGLGPKGEDAGGLEYDALGVDDENKIRQENQQLKQQLATALESLSDARHVGPLPRSPRKSPHMRLDHARVFVGDLHGFYQDLAAVDAFITDMKYIQPACICLLGDMLDCGGFLAQHQTLGFVAEGEYTFEQDVAATNEFLNRLQSVCPEATIDYLEGNHEHRIEKWCITQTLRNSRDARMLFDHFNPSVVLSLDKRGIRYVPQDRHFDGVSIRGTVRYGKDNAVYATHGITACKHAAAKHVERFGGNVVYGHTHRADSYIINQVTSQVIGAWSPGCLCQRVRLWNHNQPDNWVTGYHLQLVSHGGRFQPMNIKFVDGVSLLRPLLDGSSQSIGKTG